MTASQDQVLPLVLTVPEVAQLLRIGRNAAYALVASGAVYGVRCGRSLRIPRSAVLAFLDEGRRLDEAG